MEHWVDITGIGVIAGGQRGVRPVWDLLSTRGEPIQKMPEVDWSAELGRKNGRRWSAATRMAVVAAREASTGAPDVDRTRVGVFFTPTTTTNDVATAARTMFDTGRLPGAQLTGRYATATAIDAVANEIDAAGPAMGFEAACASSAVAVGAAALHVQAQLCDVAYAGGADCQIDLESQGGPDFVQESFAALRIASRPEGCRPFDLHRSGMFSGPGAAIIRLERHADTRSMASVVGSSTVHGGQDFYSPEPDGSSLAAAIRQALDMAELTPADIGLVIAHGTGTTVNDAAEAQAIRATVGSETPVTSIKSRVGHTSYASGALNIVTAVMCMRQRRIVPTNGTETIDPQCDIDVVLEHRVWNPKPTLCLSMGLGGFNNCVVVVPSVHR